MGERVRTTAYGGKSQEGTHILPFNEPITSKLEQRICILALAFAGSSQRSILGQ